MAAQTGAMTTSAESYAIASQSPYPPIFHAPLSETYPHRFHGLLTNMAKPFITETLATAFQYPGNPRTATFGVVFPGNPYDDAIVLLPINQIPGNSLIPLTLPIPPKPSLHEPHIRQESGMQLLFSDDISTSASHHLGDR